MRTANLVLDAADDVARGALGKEGEQFDENLRNDSQPNLSGHNNLPSLILPYYTS